MNRKPRRASVQRIGIIVDFGRLNPRDPNRGASFACYLCDTAHPGSGLVRIASGGSTAYVPLCDDCMADADRSGNAIVRKLLDAPDLKLTDGGELTDEQFNALRDKQDTTEH